MMTTILEAAFRSLLMGACVWGAIRLLRVRAVLAQKVAWVLVLAAAVVMPLVMRAPFLALDKALTIPVSGIRAELTRRFFTERIPVREPAQLALASEQRRAIDRQGAQPVSRQATAAAKPSAAHRQAAEAGLREMATERLAVLVPESAAEAVVASIPKPVAASTVQAISLQAPFWTWARVASGLAILYLGVAGVLLLRTMIGLAMAFRLWQRADPVAQDRSIRVSRETLTPVTVASTVILPADYAEWDATKLRIVLAHEQSHVQQRDFYLQLAAALHAAIFWFSPLGWWLQRKLSDLGEALSDRAGLAQAPDAASYAQILLEFAAMPRKHPWSNPVAGVAMARSSNLSGRIERILNDRRFRLAFLGGRRHALLSAVLVPVALLAAVALIHFGPAVHAARSSNQFKAVSFVQETPPAPAPLPPAPALAPLPAPAPPEEAPEPPDASEMQAPEVPAPIPAPAPAPARARREFAAAYEMDEDRQGSFAILNGKNSTVTMSGRYGKELALAKQKYGTNFIWFERDGKSYVITDPSIVERSQELFKQSDSLGRLQADLDAKQAVLDTEMASAAAEQATVKLDSPEFKEEMQKLQVELSRLDSLKIKELTEKVTQEKIAEIQDRVGAIQEHLGEIQGRIGERQGEIGKKQGEIGERMGKLGEEMGRIGEQQGKMAEEASRKMQSVIDQAIKDGKAKPVE